MNLTVNERTLNNIISDGKSNEDIIAFLNQVIDEELEKDNPDCDLIDDCIDAIADMQESHEMPALRLVLTCKSIKEIVNPKRSSWKQLNVALRAAIIAAIIASSTFTVNATVKLATNVDILEKITSSITSLINRSDDNDGELNAEIYVPAKEESTTTSTKKDKTAKKHIEYITQSTAKAHPTKEAEATTKGFDISKTENAYQPTDPYTRSSKAEFVGIRAEFKGFKTAYIYGEELSYKGLKIFAKYSDNTEKEIPLESCAYSKNIDMNVTADYTLSVTYKACTVKADITVRPDEATRFSSICKNESWDYLLTDEGVYLTKYNGNKNDIEIHSIDSKPIVAITSKVFKDSNITSFNSSSLRVIYQEAFENAKALVNCNTPNVISIGNNAFKNDRSLTSIKFSNSLNNLGESAFESTAITELSIPNGITKISKGLCNNCERLERVIFNGKVESIGDSAFNCCYNLKAIKGAKSIKNVGYFAFNECELLELDSIPRLENVDDSAFSLCSSINFGDIGESFKSLGANAFEHCEKITGITIPSCIKEVPASCFNGVPITSLTVENGVEEIDASAFKGNRLTTIVIPKSVKYIGEYAIYSTSLNTIRIESKNAEIMPYAIYKNKRAVIEAFENSTAHTFATENGLKFKLIEEE